MALKVLSARHLRTVLLPSFFLGFTVFLFDLHSSGDPTFRYAWDSLALGGEGAGAGTPQGEGTPQAYLQPGVSVRQGSRREMINTGTESTGRGGWETVQVEVGKGGVPARQEELLVPEGRGGTGEVDVGGPRQEAQGVQLQALGGGPGSSPRKGSSSDALSEPEATAPGSGEEASASAAATKPAKETAETSAESSAETTAEKSAQESAETSADGATDRSADGSAERSGEESADKSEEASPGRPQPVDQAHAPAPLSQPAQALSLKPAPPRDNDSNTDASGTSDASSAKDGSDEVTAGDSSAELGSGDTTAAAGASARGPNALPTIIGVTATYPRAAQEMYLTRLVATLRLVPPPFVWIVVEAPTKTEETASVLNRTADLCLPLGRKNCRRVPYIHMETGKADIAKFNAAVASRNAALDYIEKNRIEGNVYIMDDDNTYCLQIFDEIRKVKYLGTWPVSLMRTVEVTRNKPGWPSKPVVERALANRTEDGQWRIFGWETTFYYLPRKNNVYLRTFNMDMASFAFRSSLLWEEPDPKTGYPKKPLRLMPTRMGFLENEFLKRFQESPDTIEVLADGSRDVLVFHAHIEANQSFYYPRGWYLEQPEPGTLVSLEDDRGQLLVGMEKYSWPYVVNDTRHGLKNRSLPPIVVD